MASLPAPEGGLLFVEDILDFPRYLWLVMRVAADTLDGGDNVCTEVQVVCQSSSNLRT